METAQVTKKGFYKRWWFWILIGVVFFVFAGLKSDSKIPTNQTTEVTQSQIQQTQISEAQCIALKDEFYSLIAQEPVQKTQPAKELLEQYAADSGIPVKRSNPNVRYVLPKSDCGTKLNTALEVIIAGEKKAMSNN